MRIKNLILFFTIATGISFNIEAQTNTPINPVAPEVPTVPGADLNRNPNAFPSPHPLPRFNAEISGSVTIIDSYDLTIISAHPNGNTRNNAANDITNARYVLYSNGNIEIKLTFTNGTVYTYHLRNPRSRLEISSGLFRETFDAVVRVDNQFLLEQYICELSYNENTVTSFNLIGNNRVIVLINFRKKQ